MESRDIDRLLEEYGASLVLYARQWCRDPDDAVQIAFLDLMRVATDPIDPVGWLFATVRRRAINLTRTEQRIATRQRRARDSREPWFSVNHERRLQAEELSQMLATLPEIERQIVVAKIWGDLSFDQIAELVGKSRSSVHRRYHQSLARLGRTLGITTEDRHPTNETESRDFRSVEDEK